MSGVVRQISAHANLYAIGKTIPFDSSPYTKQLILKDIQSHASKKYVGNTWTVHGPLRQMLLDIYKPTPYLMTIIREPVDRLLSAYYYWGKEYFARPEVKMKFEDPNAPATFAKYKCSQQECWRWGYFKYLKGNTVSSLFF